MKKTTIVLICFLMISAFSLQAYASNIDEYAKDSLEACGADELSDYLSDETKGYLEKIGCGDIDFEKMLDLSPEVIFELVFEFVRGEIKEPFKAMLKVTGIILLVSTCSGFFPDDEKSRTVLNLICGCVTVLGVFAPAMKSIGAAVSAIGVCADFEKALIPVLAGILTANGKPSLALTYRGAAFAAAEFVGSLASETALPLIGVSASLGITGAMLPTLRLSAISEMIRKTATTVLGCTAGLFTGFLSLKSVLSSSADGLVVKGVKMASSFIPVVGNALGEAYTSVFASMSLLRSTIGIYAIIVFFVTGIPVVINIALWILAMRIACSISELLDCRVCSEILRNIAFVFSLTNAILLLCLAVFIISSGLVVLLKSGG